MRTKKIAKRDIREISLIKKADILLVFIVLFSAVAALFYYSSAKQSSLYAEITVDGELYRTVNLTDMHEETITIQTDPSVTLKVSGGSIAFTDSHCPDHYCERTGSLKNSGNTAVCLPAKVMVTVVSDSTSGSASDAVSY